MKIGNLNLGNNAILAPMAEVTDAPFRQICREFGAGLTFTQMVSAQGIINNSFKSLKFLAFNRNEKPVGVQLLGNNPDYIKKAIQEIKSLQPDIIDLNCGCSVPNVCRFEMGAGILDNPYLLGTLVKAMKDSAGEIPISIKMRLGRDKQNNTLLKNAEIAEKNGASAVMIHARYRSDAYSDNAEWKWIKDVKKSLSIPVIGNGSLFEPQDCIRLMEETGCDSVIIGRGALGNPFIFKRLNSILETGKDPGFPSIDEVKKTALHHFHLILKDSGEINGIKKARKFLIWYFMFFRGIGEFINNIFSLKEKNLVIEFIEEHSEKIKNYMYPEEDLSYIKKSFNERVLFWINSETKEVFNY